MNRRNIPTVAILLTTFLLAIPLLAAPALADDQSGPSLRLQMDSRRPDIGGSTTGTIMVSNIQNLQGYDVRLDYNPDVLTADPSSPAIVGTVFGTPPAGCQTRDPIHQYNQAIGEVRYSVFFRNIDPNANCTVSVNDGAPMLIINFQVNNPPGPSASWPSPMAINGAVLVTRSPGGPAAAVTPTTTGSSLRAPQSDLRLVGPKCNAVSREVGENAPLDDILFCKIANISNENVTASADFTYHTENGIRGSISTPSQTLKPGQVAFFDVFFTFPNADNEYHFTGTAVEQFSTGATLPDGHRNFSVEVSVCC